MQADDSPSLAILRPLGRALLEASRRILQADAGARLREHCLGAWVPSPEAEAFAGALGFVPERTYWRMERRIQPVAGPAWPSDVEVTTLDPASERALADWNDAYNLSFADHHHFVRSTVDDLRKVFATSTFDPGGLRLVRERRRVRICPGPVQRGC